MLSAAFDPGFSKTARSHPGHREAGRDGKHELAIAVFGRRIANDVGEGPAESAEAAKADVEADVSDAARCLPQQEHRPLHPPALQVAMRRLAESRAKGPYEMSLGNRRDLRQVGDVERLRVGAIHRVACSPHAAIELLSGPGHPTMLRGGGTSGLLP